MIKKVITICLILIISKFSFSQSENIGNYGVGFNYFKTTDISRNYRIGNDTVKRPMLIHFWYPAENNPDLKKMTFKEYIDLIAIREDFETKQKDVDQMTEGFVNAYLGFSKQLFGIDTAITTEDVLNSPVKATYNAQPVVGTFPLIIYAPSNSKSAVQNHIMCEYLASKGYNVISVGSAGYETLKRYDQKKATWAQVNDLEFIVKYMSDSLRIDCSKIGIFGFSTGSMASVLFQMRNPEVQALASLDGSHEYAFYRILKSIDEVDLNKVKIPYLIITNKFKDYSIFPFYSNIPTKDKFLYRMKEIDHNGFISYWQQFAKCGKNSNQNKFSASYTVLCNSICEFFNAALKSRNNSLATFQIHDNELIQKDTTDYTCIAQWLNQILRDGIEISITYLKKNNTLYKGKANMINVVGKMFVGNDNDVAIKIFKANTEIHPNSWESFYNLALAYKEGQEKDNAIEAIIKAGNMNKENKDIQNLYHEIIKMDVE